MPWATYWLWAGFASLSYWAFFAIIYSILLSQPAVSFIERLLVGFRLSIVCLGGTATAITMSPAIELAMAIQSLFWLALFGLLVATLTTRLSRSRNGAKLLPVTAVSVQSDRIVLEFRLVVFPHPALLTPQLFVTLNTVRPTGERDNVPLEIHPIQVPRVQYYLGFHAALPHPYQGTSPTVSSLPKGTVDVYVNAIDDGSDQPVLVHQELEIPRDARVGRFADAVKLDTAGRIIGVLRDRLSTIQNPSPPSAVPESLPSDASNSGI
jgi:hypothetical protein